MTETAKKSWRPGVMTWLIIGGLLLIIIAIVSSNNMTSVAILRQLIFEVDCSHWPVWYAVNFWVMAIGLSAAFLIRLTKMKSRHYHFYILTGTVVVGIVFFNSTWLAVLRSMITGPFVYGFYTVYQAAYRYYYVPMIRYMDHGDISWQLMITPMTAVILIGFLLLYRHHQTKRRNNHG